MAKDRSPIFDSAAQLARSLRSRRITAVELVEMHIERHIEVDDRLNAVVMNCYERARREARELDARARRGEFAGPLHGLPITIKDSFDTEGVISTAGTLGRQQFVPKEDATVVARVRRAGAILLGKTNTPEFTLGGLGLNTTGNLLHGSTHNPYDLARSAYASSGGAAAAVAAGLAAFDIGSDWSGSIRLPAHYNGVVGIRPTSVRVPRTGSIVPYGGVCDLWQAVGPICRRVDDLSLIMPVISGPDFRDAACAPVPWNDPQHVALDRLRAAYITDNGASGDDVTDEDTRSTVRQVADWLRPEVAAITEDAPHGVLQELGAASDVLRSGDGFASWQRLAQRWGTNIISPLRKRWIDNAKPVSTADFIAAWENHDRCKARLLQWIAGYDVFVCPVDRRSAPLIDSAPARDGNGSRGGWPYSSVFASAGWPVVVVRAGTARDSQMPIGVQVVAPPWREDVCLAVASLIEAKGGGWRRPPL